MGRKHNEASDLRLVSDELARRGVTAERFAKDELKAGKTPDFRLRVDLARRGFCEVKATTDFRWDDAIDLAPPLTLVAHTAANQGNRIERAIETSAKQLRAVNPSGSEGLNLLAIVNYDADGTDLLDLEEAIVGYLTYNDGHRLYGNPFQTARVREKLDGIDAILWFDHQEQKLLQILVLASDQDRMTAVCDLLRIDAEKIRQSA